MLGETISHYEILEKLGEGGMGVVYKARDTKLDRTVAIKFLPAHLSADSEAKKRFVQEAKSASALDHPNICTIHEIDEIDDGATFIAMACYDGKTLREMIDEGPLEIAKAVDIVSQISSGLAKAHENGIVHRDIKPANIILTSDGHVKILDFGIAKLEGATRMTREGSTLGTAAYMSPEQATGAEAGPGADVWATGVILYEMLTGRPPFAGEHEAAMLYGIVHEEPDQLPEEVKGANPDIQPFIDKALAKDLATRFSDSGEMRSTLEELSDESVRTGSYQRKSTGGFFSKPVFRWGIIVVLIAVSAFIMLKYAGQQGGQPADPLKIAVLPFANLGSPDDDYFSDGITDEINARLASVQSIRVIARQSVIRYKGSDKSVEEITDELGGVDYIIQGTVQRERPSDPSSRVRIIPQLIFTKDGTQIWTDKYIREMADIFTIQSDIAEEIAKALDVALPGSSEKGGEKIRMVDLRAYEFYLKGNSMVEQPYYDIDNMLATVEMYKKALDIKPDYVDALVALAIQSCWLAFHGHERDSMSVRASEALDRVLELDPQNPGVYRARGTYNYVFYKDFKAAMSDYKAYLDLNPSSLEAQNYVGFAQRRFGRWEEARKSFLKAKELDPGTVSQNFVIAEHLLWMRRYDEAEQYFDLVRELDPDDLYNILKFMQLYLRVDGTTDRAQGLLHETISRTESDDILFTWIDDPTVQRMLVFGDSLLVERMVDADRPDEHLIYGEMYYQTGEMDLARVYYDSLRAILEQGLSGKEEVSLNLYPDYSWLGFVYARLGMKEKAVEYGELAVEKLPVSADALQGMIHMETLAMIYAIAGEGDKAFDLLDKILAMPVAINITPAILRLDPLWDPIRDDSRFDRLIEKYSEAPN